MTQLSLFPQQKKQEPKTFSNKNWKTGDRATMGVCIAYCETEGRNMYCQMQLIEIKEISGEWAKVETTKEWEIKTWSAAPNKAGLIWKVRTKDLNQIF